MGTEALERDTARPDTQSDPVEPSSAALRAVVLAGGALLVLFHSARFSALGPTGLNDDIGIQHYLARITADGAVPLIDFEHGWNTASWYFSALLHQLAGGNPSTWVFLWAVVLGPLLAGLLLLVIAYRLRLAPAWTAALLGGWVATLHLPHSKYAIPMAWLLILLPVGVLRRDGWAQALRIGMVATMFWFHVELAVLLGAGTAMYDLFAARGTAMGQRFLRVGAIGAGLLLGLASQVAVYGALGLPATEVLRQVLIGQTGTYDLHFGYPLGNPQTFRVLVYPASLVLPFVPIVWRRLSDPTRFAVMLHLSQALIGIRRPGDGHVGAAATLLAVVAVLVLRDLVADRPSRLRRPDGAAAIALAAGTFAAGAAWFGIAIAGGFRIESLLAVVMLSLACLLAILAARSGDLPWAGVGAVAAAAVLLVTGLGGRTAVRVADDQGAQQAIEIAAATGAQVARCVPGGAAWVVPSPLMLYETLQLENPTPWYLFWYHFEGDLPRVRALIDAGEVPAIIQPYGWPESMASVVPFLEERYELCDEVLVPATGNLVRFWRYTGQVG